MTAAGSMIWCFVRKKRQQKIIHLYFPLQPWCCSAQFHKAPSLAECWLCWWVASLNSLASVWGKGGGAWDTRRQQPQIRAEKKKKWHNVEAEEQARWNTLCVFAYVCVKCSLNYHCLQQWKNTVHFSQKNTSQLFSNFLFFSFFPFLCCLVVWGRKWVFICVH